MDALLLIKAYLFDQNTEKNTILLWNIIVISNIGFLFYFKLLYYYCIKLLL